MWTDTATEKGPVLMKRDFLFLVKLNEPVT